MMLKIYFIGCFLFSLFTGVYGQVLKDGTEGIKNKKDSRVCTKHFFFPVIVSKAFMFPPFHRLVLDSNFNDGRRNSESHPLHLILGYLWLCRFHICIYFLFGIEIFYDNTFILFILQL